MRRMISPPLLSWVMPRILHAPKRADSHTVHSGVLATLADIGMGYAMAFSSEPPLPLITVSMTVDYLGAVQVGEWMVVRLEHHKRGRQMAFATVSLQVGDKVVARANAVFAVPRAD